MEFLHRHFRFPFIKREMIEIQNGGPPGTKRGQDTLNRPLRDQIVVGKKPKIFRRCQFHTFQNIPAKSKVYWISLVIDFRMFDLKFANPLPFPVKTPEPVIFPASR